MSNPEVQSCESLKAQIPQPSTPKRSPNLQSTPPKINEIWPETQTDIDIIWILRI